MIWGVLFQDSKSRTASQEKTKGVGGSQGLGEVGATTSRKGPFALAEKRWRIGASFPWERKKSVEDSVDRDGRTDGDREGLGKGLEGASLNLVRL